MIAYDVLTGDLGRWYRKFTEGLAKYITTWQALLFCTNCDIIVLAITNTNERPVVMKTAEQYK